MNYKMRVAHYKVPCFIEEKTREASETRGWNACRDLVDPDSWILVWPAEEPLSRKISAAAHMSILCIHDGIDALQKDL